MTALPDARTAAEALMFDKEAIARSVTKRLYDEYPDLIPKHGERGRVKTLQDMHYNIEHLIPAVDLEQPELFATYVRWLNDMLNSRGVSTRDVRRCVELMGEEARERYDERVASAVTRVVDAGLAALEQA
jgi:hypothetical protein